MADFCFENFCSLLYSAGPYSIPWSPAAPAAPKLNCKFLILYQWKICILRNTVHYSWSPLKFCALQRVMAGMKKEVREWEQINKTLGVFIVSLLIC